MRAFACHFGNRPIPPRHQPSVQEQVQERTTHSTKDPQGGDMTLTTGIRSQGWKQSSDFSKHHRVQVRSQKVQISGCHKIASEQQ